MLNGDGSIRERLMERIKAHSNFQNKNSHLFSLYCLQLIDQKKEKAKRSQGEEKKEKEMDCGKKKKEDMKVKVDSKLEEEGLSTQFS